MTENNGNTSFDPFAFTRSVLDLLQKGMLEDAQQFVHSTVANKHLSPQNYRVAFANNLIKSCQSQKERFRKKIQESGDFRYEVLQGLHDSRSPISGIPERLSTSTPPGVYVTRFYAGPLRTSYDFTNINSEHVEKLLASGFGKEVASVQRDTVFVEDNCRLSAMGRDDATLITGGGLIHETRSGRVAKASRSVLLKDVTHEIPEALVLPFPHSSGNYYHSLSEMAYGLRFYHLIADRVPIIYDEDPFSLLPVLCKSLNIDESRLVKREAVCDGLIRKAYLPDAPNFYWSAYFFSFFRSIHGRLSDRGGKPTLLYISRQKSRRAGDYETNLQQQLHEVGFSIIHAQDLSFFEQMDLFARADCIIAPHGAGIANIAFAKSSVKIIEIFSSNMISPDFFQRSKYLTRNYHPVLAPDYAEDIWDLVSPLIGD